MELLETLAVAGGILFVFWLVYTFVRAVVVDGLNRLILKHRRAPSAPPLRSIARVTRPFSYLPEQEPLGKVECEGAIWNARCGRDEAKEIAVGDRVRVQGVDGLTLSVTRHDVVLQSSLRETP